MYYFPEETFKIAKIDLYKLNMLHIFPIFRKFRDTRGEKKPGYTVFGRRVGKFCLHITDYFYFVILPSCFRALLIHIRTIMLCLFQCFVYHLHTGVRAGGGIGMFTMFIVRR